MDKNVRDIMNIKLEKAKQGFERNQMLCDVFETVEESNAFLLKELQNYESVSLGGSQTLFECGLVDAIRKLPIRLLDRYEEGLSREQQMQLYRETFLCDAYVCSSNAFTIKGELVNVDGNGNRVAAMIFGPNKVFVVVGENKLVEDEEHAYTRIREYAAPMNNHRLEKKNPCTVSGSCIDCSSETRICCSFVTLKKQMNKNRIHVLIVKSNLGY